MSRKFDLKKIKLVFEDNRTIFKDAKNFVLLSSLK